MNPHRCPPRNNKPGLLQRGEMTGDLGLTLAGCCGEFTDTQLTFGLQQRQQPPACRVSEGGKDGIGIAVTGMDHE